MRGSGNVGPPLFGFQVGRVAMQYRTEAGFRTVRADCLDRILIRGRRHLEHVLRVYRRHYNQHRPHRALELLPPDRLAPIPSVAPDHLHRHDLLGGLIHEYKAA
jgi:putative transposase